jgi:pimeloyl-ACP methyl ester carboxylesterase
MHRKSHIRYSSTTSHPPAFSGGMTYRLSTHCQRLWIRINSHTVPTVNSFRKTNNRNVFNAAMPYAQLDSAKVHYTDINPTPAEVTKTVVFVHGLGSSQNFYFPLTYTLKGEGRRFILLDSPGAARSPLPTGDAITVQSLAGTVLELLDHLSVTKNVTVVGHSMGCLVALHMAQRAPEKIEGLVLLGPVYPSAGLAEVFAKRIPAVQEGE